MTSQHNVTWPWLEIDAIHTPLQAFHFLSAFGEILLVRIFVDLLLVSRKSYGCHGFDSVESYSNCTICRPTAAINMLHQKQCTLRD